MPKHAVDELGIPLDPELKKLEFHLGHLAAYWRGSGDNQVLSAEIVKEYHSTMAKLYELGWDGELNYDSELPERLMPHEYWKRAVCGFAAHWRERQGNPELQAYSLKGYQIFMASLYASGWEGELEPDCQLPDELMPKEYWQHLKKS